MELSLRELLVMMLPELRVYQVPRGRYTRRSNEDNATNHELPPGGEERHARVVKEDGKIPGVKIHVET